MAPQCVIPAVPTHPGPRRQPFRVRSHSRERLLKIRDAVEVNTQAPQAGPQKVNMRVRQPGNDGASLQWNILVAASGLCTYIGGRACRDDPVATNQKRVDAGPVTVEGIDWSTVDYQIRHGVAFHMLRG